LREIEKMVLKTICGSKEDKVDFPDGRTKFHNVTIYNLQQTLPEWILKGESDQIKEDGVGRMYITHER
jgi:hypothetical protein